jgi:hypothetical protein
MIHTTLNLHEHKDTRKERTMKTRSIALATTLLIVLLTLVWASPVLAKITWSG